MSGQTMHCRLESENPLTHPDLIVDTLCGQRETLFNAMPWMWANDENFQRRPWCTQCRNRADELIKVRAARKVMKALEE